MALFIYPTGCEHLTGRVSWRKRSKQCILSVFTRSALVMLARVCWVHCVTRMHSDFRVNIHSARTVTFTARKTWTWPTADGCRFREHPYLTASLAHSEDEILSACGCPVRLLLHKVCSNSPPISRSHPTVRDQQCSRGCDRRLLEFRGCMSSAVVAYLCMLNRDVGASADLCYRSYSGQIFVYNPLN